VSQQLKELTIHIESENYEQTLQKLENLNVEFTNPEDVNQCIKANFKNCKKSSPKAINPFKQLFKFLLIINLFVPYLIWKNIAQLKIKEIEFTSTFRFAIAITIVPIFVLLVMLILGSVFQIKFALMYLINVVVLALLSIKL